MYQKIEYKLRITVVSAFSDSMIYLVEIYLMSSNLVILVC